MTTSRLLLLYILSILTVPNLSRAGGTRIWEMAGFEELEMGELEGTTLSSRGEVSIGLASVKLDTGDNLGAVWSATRGPRGDIYLGTGYDGKIFRKRGNAITHIADTGQLVVTAMVLDNDGNLYFSALPDANIWRIMKPESLSKPTKPEKWAHLPKGVNNVFSLAFDAKRRILFAGTGPEGDIFAIGKDSRPQKYLETDEEHILSLALDNEGNLLAGTSPEARLLRITGPGRSMALADYDATEVKAIAVGRENTFVAVNKFKSPPKVPKKNGTATASTKTSSVIGDGEIFSVDSTGRTTRLWAEKKSHVVSLALTSTDKLFAGLGTEGKIVSIDKAQLIRTELDLEERQVMSLIADKSLLFAGTGDAGAAYTIAKARHNEAFFLSPILDAETVSQWGRLTWLSNGRLKVQARSGNTMVPDSTWSDWSTFLKENDEIPCTPAHYLQLKFGFSDDADAVLISAQLAYLPQNLRATISEFNPDTPFPDPSSNDDHLSERTIASKPDIEADPEQSLRWKVDNPDGDEIRFRIFYRRVGDTLWRPILKDDQVLTGKRYTWNTTSVPEGNYQLKLTADDSISNDPRETTEDAFISVPVLIDNHQPKVVGLAIKKDHISGVAKDGFSNIGAIELSIDNSPWLPLSPKDGIYDEKQEAFDAPLPDSIPKGPHAAAVRTFDRRGNIGIAEVHFTIK